MKKLTQKKCFLIALLAVALILIQVGSALSRKIAPHDPVKKYVSKCSFFAPVRYKNLTIIPIRGEFYSSRNGGFLTLDEAISSGSLIVKEVSRSGSVNSLAVINDSKKPVFIMAGEILRGSKQDRVLKSDVILPPKSGKVIVDVYCVESGRWAYKSDKFSSANQTANISVRQAARESKSQSGVWDSVAKTNKKFKAAPSGSLSRSFESSEVKRDKVAYTRRLVNIPAKYPRANGVAVLINGRVLVVDIFSDRRIFKKMWNKLADSYVLEALSQRNSRVSSDYTKASEFLAEVQTAKISYSRARGAGKRIEISSMEITGSGILYNNSPIHLDIFPRAKKYKKPYKSPGIRRDYRQQQQDSSPPIE